MNYHSCSLHFQWKTIFFMKKIIFFLTAICVVVIACTKDKTDYEAEIDNSVSEHFQFEEATSVHSEKYIISLEALNGALYKGYNELRLKITNKQTKETVKASDVTFLPILTNVNGGNTSCPHSFDFIQSTAGYFTGYSVFTSKSSANENWVLFISFKVDNQTYTVNQTISILEQPNKNLNMTAFLGEDDEKYFIALKSPQKPKISENILVAGIYKFNKPTTPPSGSFPDPSQFSYTEASGYTLKLDPRMPESSMGNHSSPNNKDLTQQPDGMYQGIVNYTMTGNWTLNFIMLNNQGEILKGTEVSKDFTPGLEGAKSNLFIDILF